MTFVERSMENIIGYLAATIVGVSLGLIGSGGSIVIIPVLVYLFHIDPQLATTYSLFIVGATALVGGVRGILNKTVDLKNGVLISIPSVIAVYITRHYLLPYVPDAIFSSGEFTLTKNMAIMIFFSLVMIAASIRMILDKKIDTVEKKVMQGHFLMIILQGFVLGIVTGIIGAGGGFLIIPALVLLGGLPIKTAVGTSLVIIAINALVGFIGDMELVRELQFPFMILITLLSIAGVFFGIYLSKFISGKNLSRGFGWFALAVAVFIITKEIAI